MPSFTSARLLVGPSGDVINRYESAKWAFAHSALLGEAKLSRGARRVPALAVAREVEKYAEYQRSGELKFYANQRLFEEGGVHVVVEAGNISYSPKPTTVFTPHTYAVAPAHVERKFDQYWPMLVHGVVARRRVLPHRPVCLAEMRAMLSHRNVTTRPGVVSVSWSSVHAASQLAAAAEVTGKDFRTYMRTHVRLTKEQKRLVYAGARKPQAHVRTVPAKRPPAVKRPRKVVREPIRFAALADCDDADDEVIIARALTPGYTSRVHVNGFGLLTSGERACLRSVGVTQCTIGEVAAMRKLVRQLNAEAAGRVLVQPTLPIGRADTMVPNGGPKLYRVPGTTKLQRTRVLPGAPYCVVPFVVPRGAIEVQCSPGVGVTGCEFARMLAQHVESIVSLTNVEVGIPVTVTHKLKVGDSDRNAITELANAIKDVAGAAPKVAEGVSDVASAITSTTKSVGDVMLTMGKFVLAASGIVALYIALRTSKTLRSCAPLIAMALGAVVPAVMWGGLSKCLAAACRRTGARVVFELSDTKDVTDDVEYNTRAFERAFTGSVNDIVGHELHDIQVDLDEDDAPVVESFSMDDDDAQVLGKCLASLFGFVLPAVTTGLTADKLMVSAGRFKNSSEGLGMVGQFVVSCFETVVNMYRKSTGQEAVRFLSTGYAQVDMWTTAVHKACADASEQAPTEKFAREVRALHAAGLTFHADATIPRRCRPQIDNSLKQLHNLMRTHAAFSTTKQAFRPEPVCFMMLGAPGIGKSVLTTLIANEVAKVVVPEPVRAMANYDVSVWVYSKPSGEPHYDGYNGHAVIVLDDACATTTTKGDTNNDYARIMGLVNVFSVPAHMATCELKGRISIEAKSIICSTNVPNMLSNATDALTHPDAFFRRLHFPYEVVLKEAYQDPDTGRLDLTKYMAHVSNGHSEFCAWDFVEWDFKRGEPVSKVRIPASKVVAAYVARIQMVEERFNTMRSLILRAGRPTGPPGPFEPVELKEVEGDTGEATDYSHLANDVPSQGHVHRVVRMLELGRRPSVLEVDRGDQADEVYDGPTCGSCTNCSAEVQAGPSPEWSDRFRRTLVGLGVSPSATVLAMQTVSFINQHPLVATLLSLSVTFSVGSLLHAIISGVCGYVTNLFGFAGHKVNKEVKRLSAKLPKLFSNKGKATATELAEVNSRILDKLACIPGHYRSAVLDVLNRMVGDNKHPRDVSDHIESMVTPVQVGGAIEYRLSDSVTTDEDVVQSIDPTAMRERRPKSSGVSRHRVTTAKHLTTNVQGSAGACVESMGLQTVLDKVRCAVYQLSWRDEVLGRDVHVGSIWGLEGTTFMIPKHYFMVLRRGLEKGVIPHSAPIIVRNFNRPRFTVEGMTVGDFCEQRVVEMSEKDVCLCDLRVNAGCFNLTKFLLTRDELSKIDSGNVVFEFARRDPSEAVRTAHTTFTKIDMVVAAHEGVPLVGTCDALQVRVPTSAGDCGSLVCLDDYAQLQHHRLLGMHVAGNGTFAYLVVVTQEDVREMLQLLRGVCAGGAPDDDVNNPNYPVATAEVGSMFNTGKIHCMGVVTKPVNMSTRSRLRPVDAFYRILPQLRGVPFGYRPAHLRVVVAKGATLDPNVLSLAKVEHADTVWVPKNKVTQAVSSAFQRFYQHAPRHANLVTRVTYPRDLLTWDEVVSGGGLRFPHLPGINRSTSPGYPWNTEGYHSKRRFFGAGQEYTMVGPDFQRLMDCVLACEDQLLHGVRPLFVYTDLLKDELLPINKVIGCNTRLISGAPLHYVMLFRKYFGAWMNAVCGVSVHAGVCVGVNPYRDWGAVVESLSVYRTGLVFAADFKAFDANAQTAFQLEVLNAINLWYGDSPTNQAVRSILWREVYNSRHVNVGEEGLRNHIYAWSGAMPSGHPATTIINSFMNIALHAYCFHILVPSDYLFWQHVRVQTHGDDVVVHPSPSVSPAYNQNTLGGVMASVGARYQSESKTDGTIPDLRPITEVTFLKRGFRLEEGQWFAPLDIDSITKIPAYTTTDAPSVGALTQLADATLRELSLHDAKTWHDLGVPFYSASVGAGVTLDTPCDQGAWRSRCATIDLVPYT